MTSRHFLAVACIGLLAACAAPESTPEPTPTPAPTATTEASEEPPGEPGPPDREPCAGGDFCTGLIGPGEWTTDAVGGTILTLTVAEEWESDELLEAGAIALYPTDGSRSALSAFAHDGEVFTDPCDIEGGTEQLEASPEAMMEWLSGHPELEVSEPEHAMLGATAMGLRVEITAAKAQECPANQPVPPDWILLWVLPAVGDFHFNDGERAIVYALTIGEELVVVVSESVDQPDEFLPRAQPVVDSMVFEPDS